MVELAFKATEALVQVKVAVLGETEILGLVVLIVIACVATAVQPFDPVVVTA